MESLMVKLLFGRRKTKRPKARLGFRAKIIPRYHLNSDKETLPALLFP